MTRPLCVDQLANAFVNEADCARGIVGLAVAIVLQHDCVMKLDLQTR